MIQPNPADWWPGRHAVIRPVTMAALLAGLQMMGAQRAEAVGIETGNDDLKLSVDTTVKYSAAWRLKDPSPVLLANPNLDDGDRNFGKGLISNRLDLLGEMDLVYAKRYGARLSAAGWYDDIYNRRNDNPGFAGGAFPNQTSVPADQFTDATRKVHGRKVELLDAFVFGNADIGDGRASIRLGRHTLLWGESLFLGVNAIAGAMAPVDVVKLVSVPNTQFKEAIRPVPQVSAQWQISPDVSVGAYYQFRWSANRLPAVGSYFEIADTFQDGGEQLLLAGPGSPFLANAQRMPDQRARNGGQGGLQVRFRAAETDFGAYLVRFHDKSPQQVVVGGFAPVVTGPGGACVIPGSVPAGAGCVLPGAPVGYRLAYHEGIVALGASASHTFGDVNVAVEASVRRNQDLASSGATDLTGLGGAGGNNSGDTGYAVGRTAHINISALWTLPQTPLFREGTFLGELAWNRVLSVTRNPVVNPVTGATALDPNGTRDAWTLRMQVEPLYRQVVGGVDLGVPIGVGYSPKGSRSLALGPVLPAEKGGDLTVGLNATYLDSWRFSLAWTHYFGHEAPVLDASNAFSYQQYLKDRDFIALSVRRSF
jgi:hypothetical protein